MSAFQRIDKPNEGFGHEPPGVDSSVPRGKRKRARRGVRAILILGMHRSGTSPITRVFSLLGADLPKNLLGIGPGNEAGHWESQDLISIHDEILSSAGSFWHDWRAFNPEWLHSDTAEAYKDRMLRLLRRDFDRSRLFVLKDPRMCRLVPLWLELLEELEAKPAAVIPIRNPLEVAASLRERDGIAPAKSYLMWLRHVLDAEKATRGLPRAVTMYDTLLADWQAVVSEVAVRTKLVWPRRSATVEAEIERFLTFELRHHAIPRERLVAKPEIVDWVKEAYAALVRMAEAGEDQASMARLDCVRAEFEKASLALGPVLAEEELDLAERRAEAERLKAEVVARDTQIVELDTALAYRSGEAERLASELAAREARVQELERALANRSGEAERLASGLTAREARIQELESALANRSGEAERLASELAAHEARVQELDRALANRSGEAERLANELAAIQASTSWRITALARSVLSRLPRTARLLRRLIKLAWWTGTLQIFRRLGERQRRRKDLRLVAASGLFDAAWYLKQYPDVAVAGVDPLVHFIAHGAAEGRDPSPLFDTSYYLEANPDVAAAKVNPLAHFVCSGASKGRAPRGLTPQQSVEPEPRVRKRSSDNPLKQAIRFRAANGELTWSAQDISEVQAPFVGDPSQAVRFLAEREGEEARCLVPDGARIGVYTSTGGNYFFNEMRNLIVEGLREIGYQPIVKSEESSDDSDVAINIVVAPHEFFLLGRGSHWLNDSFLSNCIVVNTEQWQTQWFAKSLPALLRAPRIFDINLQSAAGLRSLGLPASFLPLGFVREFAPFAFHARLPNLLAMKGVARRVHDYTQRPNEKLNDRPLDVVFIGTNTPRREAFFAGHATAFARWYSFLYLPRSDQPFLAGPNAAMTTEAVTGLEQRAKILLNIHRNADRYFEWHRIVLHGFWQKAVVVTERCHRVPGFLSGEHYFEAEPAEIPEVIEWLLSTKDGQMAAETARQSAFSVLSREYLLGHWLARLLSPSSVRSGV